MKELQIQQNLIQCIELVSLILLAIFVSLVSLVSCAIFSPGVPLW